MRLDDYLAQGEQQDQAAPPEQQPQPQAMRLDDFLASTNSPPISTNPPQAQIDLPGRLDAQPLPIETPPNPQADYQNLRMAQTLSAPGGEFQQPADVLADQSAQAAKTHYLTNSYAVEDWIASLPNFVQGESGEHEYRKYLQTHPFPADAFRQLEPVKQQELWQQFQQKDRGQLPQLTSYQSAGAGMGEGYQGLKKTMAGLDELAHPKQAGPIQQSGPAPGQALRQEANQELQRLSQVKSEPGAPETMRELANTGVNLAPAIASGPAAPAVMGIQGAGSAMTASREVMEANGINPDDYRGRRMLQAMTQGTIDAATMYMGGEGIKGAGAMAGAMAIQNATQQIGQGMVTGQGGLDIPAIYKAAAQGVWFHYMTHPGEVGEAAGAIRDLAARIPEMERRIVRAKTPENISKTFQPQEGSPIPTAAEEGAAEFQPKGEPNAIQEPGPAEMGPQPRGDQSPGRSGQGSGMGSGERGDLFAGENRQEPQRPEQYPPQEPAAGEQSQPGGEGQQSRAIDQLPPDAIAARSQQDQISPQQRSADQESQVGNEGQAPESTPGHEGNVPGKSLFHETSINYASELFPKLSGVSGDVSPHAPPIWYLSDAPELATGQGNKKGVLVEFDPAFKAEPYLNKPGLQAMKKMGIEGGEFTARMQPSELGQHVRSITVRPDAMRGTLAERGAFVKTLRGLLDEGWTKTENPDGSIAYRPGEAKPSELAASPAADQLALGNSHEVRANREMESLLTKGGELSGKVEATPPQIIKAMEDAIGTPIRSGHGLHGQRKAAGWYNLQTDVIRNKVANDLSTSAHEFGHAIHQKLLDWNTRWDPQTSRELEKMGRELYGDRQPSAGYRREGVAEYIARRLMGDDMSQAAPKVDEWFNKALADHPEFKPKFDAVQELYSKWWGQGSVARVKAQINRVDDSPLGFVKRGVEKAGKLWRDLNYNLFDDAAPLRRAQNEQIRRSSEFSRETINPEDVPPVMDPSKMRQALKMTAPGIARNFVTEAAVNTKGEKVGPSLREILQPVGHKQLDDFAAMAYAYRARDLLKRKINPGISPVDAEMAANYFNIAHPEWNKVLDGVTEWNNHLLNYVVDSGGLSPEAAQAIREMNPVYVPLKRAFDDWMLGHSGGGGGGKGVINQGSATKRIKGSGRPIIDPMESLVTQAESMIGLANKVRVARSVADFAETMPGGGWFAEKIAPPKQANSFSLQEIKSQLKDIGVDLGEADLDKTLTVFNNTARYTGKENIVSIWRDGKREFWELNPDVYRAVSEMDKERLPAALRWLAASARWIRGGATGYNLPFALTNGVRDMFTLSVYSKYTRKPFEGFAGLWDQLKHSDAAEQYHGVGAGMATMIGGSRAKASELGRHMLRGTVFNTLRHPMEAMAKFTEAVEASPRIVEFRRSLAANKVKWGPDSESAVIQALLDSKEATVDFTRAGVIGGAMGQLRPYFNARLQGTAKFFSVFGQNPVRAGLKAFAMITVPSLALWMINKDEQWYQELPEYERLNNWHFSPNGGKTIFKLPVPQELGKVFGTAPVAAVNHAYQGTASSKQQMRNAAVDMLGSFLPAQSPLEMVPAALAPTVEIAANYDPQRDRKIVPDSLIERRVAADQYNKWTTHTARVIGRWLGVSPMHVEHFIGGYTGGAAPKIVRGVEGAINSDLAPSDVPGGNRFLARPAEGHGQSVNELYALQRQLQQRKGSKIITDAEKQQLVEIDNTVEQLAKIRKAIDAKEMTEDEGNKLITRMAREALHKQPREQSGQTPQPAY